MLSTTAVFHGTLDSNHYVSSCIRNSDNGFDQQSEQTFANTLGKALDSSLFCASHRGLDYPCNSIQETVHKFDEATFNTTNESYRHVAVSSERPASIALLGITTVKSKHSHILGEGFRE
jgi:hypothetical protein